VFSRRETKRCTRLGSDGDARSQPIADQEHGGAASQDAGRCADWNVVESADGIEHAIRTVVEAADLFGSVRKAQTVSRSAWIEMLPSKRMGRSYTLAA
jgi:hypothetical protein